MKMQQHNTMAIAKTTRFDTVEIRHYPFVLSDNPGGSYGPPIELGWEYTENRLRLSEYEMERQGKRRKRKNLYLSHLRRETMLKEANYTQVELERAIRRKNSIRRKRKISYVLINPIIKICWMIRGENQQKKLRRAKKNLQLLEGEGMFHEHSDIYGGWWLPDLV